MTEPNPAADPAQTDPAQAQADPAQPVAQADPAEPHGTDWKQPVAQADPAEPHGTDWKALARKWERQAKANKEKAGKWDAQAQAAPTVESLQQQMDELRAEADRQRESAAPIQGDDEEAMAASAAAVAEFAKSQAPSYPADKGAGAQHTPVSRESIEQIKDPVARINARAQHIDLY